MTMATRITDQARLRTLQAARQRDPKRFLALVCPPVKRGPVRRLVELLKQEGRP